MIRFYVKTLKTDVITRNGQNKRRRLINLSINMHIAYVTHIKAVENSRFLLLHVAVRKRAQKKTHMRDLRQGNISRLRVYHVESDRDIAL